MAGKFRDLVGVVTGVIVDADTAITSGPWTPQIAGRLRKIIVVVGGIAATTAIENGYIKLISSDFGGVDLYCPFHGHGANTAPNADVPDCITECDLKVSKTAIKVQYYFNVLPTTPELTIYADIEG
ncbi:hypothetical protein MUO79_05840 [Candidatus Bathyarchaeota archaeon]|nr:hypothetical protein [Candidatus Bathyarchaeota archaeon]